MAYLTFLATAAVVVIAADRLAKYGDVIAVRTHLGGLFVGTVLLAGATSLPELITSLASFQQGVPDLAVGNFLGSNMVNMVLLALVDLINYNVPLLSRVAVTHTLTAALSAALSILVVIFIMVDVPVPALFGWIGLDSVLIILLYFGGVRLVQLEGKVGIGSDRGPTIQIAESFPSLRRGLVGFGISASILMLIVPQLVAATTAIGEQTGLGTSFVGTTLLSFVTSLPELMAAYAALRIGAPDLAVGNLFGSSVFNILGLGLADFFYRPGRLLSVIDNGFAIVGLVGLLLTVMALFSNLSRIERRLWFIELDAMAIVLTYLAGMYLLFLQR